MVPCSGRGMGKVGRNEPHSIADDTCRGRLQSTASEAIAPGHLPVLHDEGGETALDWRTAAGWIVRACATYETGGSQRRVGEAGMDVQDGDGADPLGCEGGQLTDCPIDTWMNACSRECGTCTSAAIPRRARGSALPDHRRRAARPGSGGMCKTSGQMQGGCRDRHGDYLGHQQ